jgi:SAM-dependent methyltransferase
MAHQDTYAFDNALAIQRQRLATLARLFDPGSIRHLDATGVAPGWRCLEVGAGNGSIAEWLCDRVGAEGTVVATDLDTTVLRDLSRPNLDVRVHDVVVDDLPEGEYDLVHMRLVLAWLADPALALHRLVAALRPGGVLVAEEMDFAGTALDPRLDAPRRQAFERVIAAHNEVLCRSHSFDPFYGRRVAGDLTDAGLAEVAAEGRVGMWRGGADGGLIWKLTIDQLRDEMVASGIASEQDVVVALALCDDPELAVVSQVVMAAWGRRP